MVLIREAGFKEADWRGRLTSRSLTVLAYLPDAGGGPGPGDPAGLAGAFEERPGTPELVSMRVDPRARGRGVGEALVAAVADWAKTRDYSELHLWVTESNDPARKLYGRCGFTATGERQPLPPDPKLQEFAMRLEL
jgi:GNAT superfamily N-acetyltransferase